MPPAAHTDAPAVVQWQVDAGHHRLTVRGDFDAGVSAPLGALLEAIALTEPASVTLVADRLTLFGSWGLRALERGAIALAVVGVRLAVSGASPTMRRVLELFDGPPPLLLSSNDIVSRGAEVPSSSWSDRAVHGDPNGHDGSTSTERSVSDGGST